MQYLEDGIKFDLSYQELRELYIKYSSMCNEDFIQNVPHILHLCCIIGHLKEIPGYVLLKDTGLIHELAHLLTNTATVNDTVSIQNNFINLMRLD